MVRSLDTFERYAANVICGQSCCRNLYLCFVVRATKPPASLGKAKCAVSVVYTKVVKRNKVEF